MYSVYHNDKDGTLDDLAPENDLGKATRAMSGWSLRFFYYDNDGTSIYSLPTAIPTARLKRTPAASLIANRCFSSTTMEGSSRT
jgi:hypothetical protein